MRQEFKKSVGLWISSKVAIIAPRDEPVSETIQALPTLRDRFFV